MCGSWNPDTNWYAEDDYDPDYGEHVDDVLATIEANVAELDVEKAAGISEVDRLLERLAGAEHAFLTR